MHLDPTIICVYLFNIVITGCDQRSCVLHNICIWYYWKWRTYNVQADNDMSTNLPYDMCKSGFFYACRLVGEPTGLVEDKEKSCRLASLPNVGGQRLSNVGCRRLSNVGCRCWTNVGGRRLSNVGCRRWTNIGRRRLSNVGCRRWTNVGGRRLSNVGCRRWTNEGGPLGRVSFRGYADVGPT